MSREALSRYLDVSTSQIDEMRKNGTLPEYLSGTKRFDRVAVDRRLDELSGLTISQSRWKERIDGAG